MSADPKETVSLTSSASTDQAEKHVPSEIVPWAEDPQNPRNWPAWRKWTIVVSSALMTFTISLGSSIFSAVVRVAGEEFDVSSEVMLLGVALYVIGFAFGPLLFGPASELYGRTRPLWLGMALFCICQIPVGLGKNAVVVLVFRFFSGMTGSAPLAILAGMFMDFLVPEQTGISVSLFTASVFSGPTLGPICGAFITKSSLGWRWTAWIVMIVAAGLTLFCFTVTRETYAPVLLRRRAARLGDAVDKTAPIPPQPPTLKIFVTRYLTRPAHMIVLEPILILMTLYNCLTYGILYLTFAAFPIAFQGVRRWSPTSSTLPFLAMFVGVIIACLIMVVFSVLFVGKRLAATKKLNPEDRLPTMILGATLLPAGLFWFGWTSNPSMAWPAQVCAGLFMGCGIILIFMSALVYLVDIYQVNANSALAANTMLRSLVGACFPLFATRMFQNLGVAWAASTLGFICLALLPFPILLWKFGPKVRSWSKYTAKVPA